MSSTTKFTDKELEKIKNGVSYAKRCVACVDTPPDAKNQAFKFLCEIQSLIATKEKKNGSANQHPQN